MADIELVIKIPEEMYKKLLNKGSIICLSGYEGIIANGIPLPKGHGRLGDLDALEQEIISGIKAGNYEEGYEEYGHINNMDDCVECVKYADTIIEADKEQEDDNT